MAAVPQTVYARDGDVHLAYQVVSDRGPHLLFVPAQAYVAQMLQTLVEFPQRQKSASFSIDQVMAKLQEATTGSS